MEKFILHQNKRVLLLAPRAAIDTVWEPLIKRFLPELSEDVDFRDLVYLSNNDLDGRKENPERFERLAELTDAVLIDEAHNFRNYGRKGDPLKEIEPSRYYKLLDILDQEKNEKDDVKEIAILKFGPKAFVFIYISLCCFLRRRLEILLIISSHR